MAIVVNPEPGVVLVGEFDRSDPASKEEVKIFSERLQALQKQQGFEAFVPLIREDGRRLSVTIIPCALGAKGAMTDAASLGKLARDTFKGSGRLPAATAEALESYGGGTERDAGDLTSSWFTDEP